MPSLAAQRTHKELGTEKPYPRLRVAMGVLAFCLSVWASVILAVMHFS